MSENDQHLSCYVCPGKKVLNTQLNLYQKAYDCWKYVWEETLMEVTGKKQLPSDTFIRQDVIVNIFYKDDCIANIFFNQHNLSHPVARDDSYFAYWPEDVYREIENEAKRVIVSSHFTVHPDYRKRICGIPSMYILMGYMVKQLQVFPESLMLGTMRNKVGANKLAYRFHAKPIRQNIVQYGEESDIVVWRKGEAIDCANENHRELVDSVWKNRVIDPELMPYQPIENENERAPSIRTEAGINVSSF